MFKVSGSKLVPSPLRTTPSYHLCTKCGLKFSTPISVYNHAQQECGNMVAELVEQAKAEARKQMNHPMNDTLFSATQFQENLVKLTIDLCIQAIEQRVMLAQDHKDFEVLYDFANDCMVKLEEFKG